MHPTSAPRISLSVSRYMQSTIRRSHRRSHQTDLPRALSQIQSNPSHHPRASGHTPPSSQSGFSRIASDALIHGYLRNGTPIQASHELQRYLEYSTNNSENEMQRTFYAVFRRLLAVPIADVISYPPLTLKSTADVLDLQPSVSADPTSQAAIQMFLLARRYKFPQTTWMYHGLIGRLIARKESVGAALVFQTMLKDYHTSKTLSAPITAGSDTHNREIFGDSLPAVTNESIQHSHKMFNQLVAAMKRKLYKEHLKLREEHNAHDIDNGGSGQAMIETPGLYSVYQSLAIFGDLVVHRQLPFSDLSELLDAFAMCFPFGSRVIARSRSNFDVAQPDERPEPRMVWVSTSSEPSRIDVMAHIMDVMKFMVVSLPSPSVSSGIPTGCTTKEGSSTLNTNAATGASAEVEKGHNPSTTPSPRLLDLSFSTIQARINLSKDPAIQETTGPIFTRSTYDALLRATYLHLQNPYLSARLVMYIVGLPKRKSQFKIGGAFGEGSSADRSNEKGREVTVARGRPEMDNALLFILLRSSTLFRMPQEIFDMTYEALARILRHGNRGIPLSLVPKILAAKPERLSQMPQQTQDMVSG